MKRTSNSGVIPMQRGRTYHFFHRPAGLLVCFYVIAFGIATAAPVLSVDTNKLSFSAYLDEDNPADQLLVIHNQGDQRSYWNIVDANQIDLSLPDWLNVQPVSGSISAGQSGYIVAQVDISQLANGFYTYAFDIVDPAAQNSPLRIDVSVHVTGPILTISSNAFVFPFDEANFETEQTLTLENTGGGLLHWTLTDPNQPTLTLPGWLSAAPVNGTLGRQETDDIALTVDITGLSRGEHVAFLQVHGADAQSSPQIVTVTVNIGGVIYVPGAFPMIQDAIDAAAGGEIIVVFPGIYDETIEFNGKDIVLMAMKSYDPSVTDETVLDGGARGSVVTFNGQETADCILRGFVITNGYQYGAGGGISGSGTQASIDDCVIVGNIASWGGGACACNGAITHCLFSGNAAYYDGGGLALCDGLIKNCTIANNAAGDSGGGLFDCLGLVTNSIIWGNLAAEAAGIYEGTVPTYSCIQGWNRGGEGNMCADPLFSDATAGDYHLKSSKGRWNPDAGQWQYDDVTSPCIDAGGLERMTVWSDSGTPSDPNDDGWEEIVDPNALWLHELWPHGERVNMGVYGGTAQASMSLNPMGNAANLNHDTQVGLADLLLFLEQWLVRRDLLAADLNRDGSVGAADFSILSSQWLSPVEQVPPPAPAGLTLTAEEFEVALDWQDSDYEYFGCYHVYRGVNDANALSLLASGLTESRFTDPNLSDGTGYYYRVTVESLFGIESAYSERVSVQFAPPPSPTGLAALVYDDRVELDWEDIAYPYFASYNVYRAIGSGVAVLRASGLTDSHYTDFSVVGGSDYYYSVSAVSVYGSESTVSEPVFAQPPYDLYDTFESGFGNWTNVDGDDADWIRNSGGTASSGTGPDSGANGSVWYLYTEGSDIFQVGKTAILESPEINGIDRQLSFYYHMFGLNIGSLHVDVYHDAVWNEDVWNVSGQQHVSSAQEYTQATVDLSDYTGLIKIRFRGVGGGGWANDMAIDQVRITGVQ